MGAVAQGEVYWLRDGEPIGSEPGYSRPWVVVQNDATNATRIGTVLACPLTTNLRLERAPGNVLLAAGEGGLTRASVVVVSAVTARDRSLFDDFAGVVSPARVRQIVDGLLLLLMPSPEAT